MSNFGAKDQYAFLVENGEDLLDKHIVKRVESATDNHFLIDVTRCTLNPIRAELTFFSGSRLGIALHETRRRRSFSAHSEILFCSGLILSV